MALAALLLVGCAVLAMGSHPRPTINANTESSQASPASPGTTKDQPQLKGSPALPLEQLGKPDQPGSTGSGSMTSPSPPQDLKAHRQPGAINCDDYARQEVDAYNHDVAGSKLNLDDALTFPSVGSVIRGQYISDYNNKILQLFTKYKSETESAGCVFPPAKPEPLPLTYPF